MCQIYNDSRVENLYCRLSKYNVGKRVDTMSRGSYQRRVYVTVLQHNEGYQWHNKHMHKYTGEHPGYWLRKMFQRKTESFLYTKQMENNPGFVRRKPVSYDEIEKDYGIDAVEAAEQEMNISSDPSNMHQIYEVSIYRFIYMLYVFYTYSENAPDKKS